MFVPIHSKGALVVALASLFAPAHRAAPIRNPRIVVGPNVVISQDLDITHWELAADAASWDPDVLIAGGSAETNIGRQEAIYVSHDAGLSWHGSLVGSFADTQVAAGVGDGVLLFFGMHAQTTENVIGRSVDGGRNWAIQTVPFGDHPQVVVDRTNGPHRGSVYVITFGCSSDPASENRRGWTLCLYRSADDGITWDPPVPFEHNDSIGRNTTNPIVLSDGTLVLPYADFDFMTKRAKHLRNAWMILATDGGRTFGEPKLAHEIDVSGGRYVSDQPSFAADTTAKHRDRIYMAWHDQTTGSDRAFVRYSDDRGDTWSKPVLVDPTAPKTSTAYEVDIAVNKAGVLGVRWSDSRHGKPGASDEYFTASLDGGLTFLPSVRVSTATSGPASFREQQWQTDLDRPGTNGDSVSIHFWGRASGDYLAMAVDERGNFHPVWSDRRDGRTRMYTASIHVETATPSPSVAASRVTVPRDSFRVEYAPTHYNASTGVLEVPIRVRNMSGTSLYGPLTLDAELRAVNDGMTKHFTTFMTGPHILGKPESDTARSRASYDLTSLLGEDHILLPGERTRALVLRIRAQDRATSGQISFTLESGS